MSFENSAASVAIEIEDVILVWLKERIKNSNIKLDQRVHKFWQTVSCCHNGQRIESEARMNEAQMKAKVRELLFYHIYRMYI